GVEGQIRPRSGLALHHGVTVLNSPGTLDPDYRGEVHVILANFGQDPFAVERGARIAQLVLVTTLQAAIREVASLDETTSGDRGFGSPGTGREGRTDYFWQPFLRSWRILCRFYPAKAPWPSPPSSTSRSTPAGVRSRPNRWQRATACRRG